MTAKLMLFGLLLSVAGQAQTAKVNDAPPVIAVHLTDSEQSSLDAATKVVDDAQAVLEIAKQKLATAEQAAIRSHRESMNLKWADCAPFMNSVFLTGDGLNFKAGGQAEPKGYLAEIKGAWIIFTRGYSECHGV